MSQADFDAAAAKVKAFTQRPSNDEVAMPSFPSSFLSTDFILHNCCLGFFSHLTFYSVTSPCLLILFILIHLSFLFWLFFSLLVESIWMSSRFDSHCYGVEK
jgi:hypothetical protein